MVTKKQITQPRLLKLVDSIEKDIAERGLSPGDPYLNTSEVADMLRVSKNVANQAMQILASRRRLVRKQRLGTFIASDEDFELSMPIKVVYLLVHHAYLRTEGLLADGVLTGLSDSLPGVEVHFAFFPRSDDRSFTEDMVKRCLNANKPGGLMLVRASLTAQRIVCQSGLPALVYGTPQPSVHLPWAERNQETIGRLLARRALGQGNRSLVILSRDSTLPGDYPYLDGIYNEAAAAGLTLDAIRIRQLPPDEDAIYAEMVKLFKQMVTPPAVVARTERLAEAAERAAVDCGLRPDADVPIVIADVYRRGNEQPPSHPYIRSLLTPPEQGQAIGRLLHDLATGKQPDNLDIPVELVDPTN